MVKRYRYNALYISNITTGKHPFTQLTPEHGTEVKQAFILHGVNSLLQRALFMKLVTTPSTLKLKCFAKA